ncbi:MAG: aspartate kinase, partial [Lachnospiraceae bacterium]|nr:aspartate kinase [Lachnospiraceae bacterium]
MKKVVKFGGSSLADATQCAKSAAIVRADENRRYVVPSAPGKRYDADKKVTDMLYACYAKAEEGGGFQKDLRQIQARYQEIIDGLELDFSLDEEFATIEKNFAAGAGRDYAASRGEYLSGLVMAHYLGWEFVDPAETVLFDEDGNFDSEATNALLGARLSEVERAVIPGFYGAYESGRIKTFSRGGSDVTGSIVARAVMADVYENWTDVSGFLVADPRIVENPASIEVITYRELR